MKQTTTETIMAVPEYPNVSRLQVRREAPPETPALSLAELQRTLHLAGLLQASLEVDAVLDSFLTALARALDFAGARYEMPAEDLTHEFGGLARHSCRYELRLGEEDLGALTFYSRQRLGEDQLANLETLLCYLVYPLRNALLYRKARLAARHDALTGVCNRAALDAALPREVELAHRHGTPLSLVVLDLDHFKEINDTWGHAAGDAVLVELARRIQDEVRGCDLVFRYGGEEFILLLAATDRAGACRAAERIRQAVEREPVTWQGIDIPVTASLGVASLRPGDDATALFKRADEALYEAKEAGRNRTRCAGNPS